MSALEALDKWLHDSITNVPPYLIDSEGETPIDGYGEEIIREIRIRIAALRSPASRSGGPLEALGLPPVPDDLRELLDRVVESQQRRREEEAANPALVEESIRAAASFVMDPGSDTFRDIAELRAENARLRAALASQDTKESR